MKLSSVTVVQIGMFLGMCLPLMAHPSLEKNVTFSFTDDPIDVVITSDTYYPGILELSIESIKKYGTSIRDVYVISPRKVTDKAIWIDEKIFPFTIPDVAAALFSNKKIAKEYLKDGKRRTGWYLQQLLKLYAPLVIPNISSNVLILDSDVIFLQPVSFMNEKNEPLFCPGKEYHKPYFRHAAKLLPGLGRVFKGECNYSGVSHHMLMQREVIKHLFATIESTHHLPAWKAICEVMNLDPEEEGLPVAGFSEYEIYFNYIFSVSNQAHIRRLTWKNLDADKAVWQDLTSSKEFDRYRNNGYDYIAHH